MSRAKRVRKARATRKRARHRRRRAERARLELERLKAYHSFMSRALELGRSVFFDIAGGPAVG